MSIVRWSSGLTIGLGLVLGAPAARAEAPRRITPAIAAAIPEVSDLDASPDGRLVVYALARVDDKKDAWTSDLVLARTDGSRRIELTHTPASEGGPRFSPDGTRVAFLSDRGDADGGDQLWILPLDGGEASQVTTAAGGVSDFAWAPDGRHVALVVSDPDPDAAARKADPDLPPKPIVVDRYYFKEDGEGYLGHLRSHLAWLDLETQQVTALTDGDHDDVLPSVAPDGRQVAFVSKRGPDPDRTNDWNVYIVAVPDVPLAADAPRPAPRAVTTNPGSDCDPEWQSRPAWSPDGKALAIVQGGDPALLYYAGFEVALVPVGGGAATVLVPGLDRNTYAPQWSRDGKEVWFLYEDDGRTLVAHAPAAGKRPRAPVVAPSSPTAAEAFALAGDAVVVQAGTARRPAELTVLDRRGPRLLTHETEAALGGLELTGVRPIAFASAPGVEVHGFVMTPPGWTPAAGPVPTVIRIHGGPVSQYQDEWRSEWPVLAAAGWAVVGVNPRGSSGRGLAWAKAIFGDWGEADGQDVLAAADWAVAQGIADPQALGVGGWSYGGILTDQLIVRDGRFKAATSGAGLGNALAGYGTDMYVREWALELGLPWKNPDAWIRNSRPLLHADRITTPTLFLGGAEDWNVPVLHSEQLYQALRALSVPTELVVYPDESHGIKRPSFLRDRLERYVAWYRRFL